MKNEYNENLSEFVVEPKLAPFPGKDSVQRLAMTKSAYGHLVVPADNPERPLIDSDAGKSIMHSSDNYKTVGKVLLLAKVPKVIAFEGYEHISEITYIYYDYGTDKIELEVVPNYAKYYNFGYKMKSQFEEMNVGEVSEKPVFTKYAYNFDTDDEGVAFGKNVRVIYTASREVTEDAMVISKNLAKNLSLNFMSEVEVTYSPEYSILKDMHGFDTEDGKHQYRPFPLPGEEVKSEALICISSIGDSFLTIDNTVQDADNVRYVHKGSIVTDVEVYSNDVCKNAYIEEFRISQLNYIKSIARELIRLESDKEFHDKFSDNAKARADVIKSIAIAKNLRINTKYLRKKVYIKIKTVNKRIPTPGDKFTNRSGGKNTFTKVVDSIVAERTGEVDGILNVSALVNRENPGQLFEKEISGLMLFMQKYVNESPDMIEIKFKNILKWLELAKAYNALDFATHLPPADLVEFFKVCLIPLRYDSYNAKFKLIDLYNLTHFTSSLIDTSPQRVFVDGLELGEKHQVGLVFMIMLENGILKDTSIRADGIVNIKGALSKKGANKKIHQSKYNTTAPKISDIGLSVMINFFKPQDRNLLRNSTRILNDYASTMGVVFKLFDNKIL